MLVRLATESFDNWQGLGTTATLRISALQTFTTSAGEVIFGQFEAIPWFRDIQCAIGSRVDGAGMTLRTLVIPEIELPSTTDSPDNPGARFTFQVKGATGLDFQSLPCFEAVRIPAVSNLTWLDILEYNQLNPVPPSTDWRDVVLQLIAENAGGVPDATPTTAGKVRLSTAPSGAPVAISATDPRMQPATPSQTGLLSAQDKARLDGILHEQPVAATVWTVNHGLGMQYFSVIVIDSAGDVVDGKIDFENSNQLKITFSAPISGLVRR